MVWQTYPCVKIFNDDICVILSCSFIYFGTSTLNKSCGSGNVRLVLNISFCSCLNIFREKYPRKALVICNTCSRNLKSLRNIFKKGFSYVYKMQFHRRIYNLFLNTATYSKSQFFENPHKGRYNYLICKIFNNILLVTLSLSFNVHTESWERLTGKDLVK